MEIKMYKNKNGVSNTMIGILMLVTLIVAITGTIFILNGTQKVNQKDIPVNTEEKSSGLVQLEIIKPKYKQTGTSGLITLNVN
jgi:hypothetical protein